MLNYFEFKPVVKDFSHTACESHDLNMDKCSFNNRKDIFMQGCPV